MNKSLLFKTSSIFDDPNLIDNIRQSILEIENKFPTTEEVQQLLTEAISYLDKNITDDLADELFSLILHCFSYDNSQFIPLFNNIFKSSTNNQYYIIITSYILCYLINNNISIPLSDYNSFIDDSLTQILPQIEKKSIIIFDHEISPQFTNDLIINLLMSANLTNELVSNFSPYIMTAKNDKIKKLIEKISKTAFLIEIPQNVLFKIFPKIDFSIESMTIYIPPLSEQTFKSILPQIEKTIKNSTSLNSTFSINFIQKCIQLNVKIESIEKLVDTLNNPDLTPEMIEYLKKYENLKIGEKFTFEDSEVPDLEKLTDDEFKAALLDVKYLKTYLNIFQTIKKNHRFLSSPELWTQIVTVASKTEEELTDEMVNQFRLYFQIFVKIDTFDDVLNDMIFSVKPQTLNGMTFIFYLVYDVKKETSKKCLTPLKKKKLLLKMIENKMNPPNCFWKLYTKSLIYKEFKENPHPLFLYGYQFANGEFEHEFDLVTILPQNEISEKNLSDFINHERDSFDDKFELKIDMDEAAVSLISCAFLFTRFEGIVQIEGLSSDIILPFLAIVFDYSNLLFPNENDRNEILIDIFDHFKEHEKFSLIKEALKNFKNNDSPIQKASIDFILPNLYPLFDSNSFSFHVCLSFIEILSPFLLNGLYQANKMILLSAIFQFSNGENKKNNDDMPINMLLFILFRDNSNKLFDFVVKNLSEINECENLRRNPLNISIFEDSIASLIIDTINDISSTDDAVLFMNFILKMCQNVPVLHFENSEKIEKILNETIKEQKSDKASIVFQFMIKNGLSDDLHHLFEYPILLSYLQNDTIRLIQEILFKNFMKNESISTEYFIILLQKAIFNTNYLSAEEILKLYSNEYNNYTNSFIKAVNFLFICDKITNNFVLKPELTFSSSTIQISIISKLFEIISSEKNSQFNAFILLKSIAYSFPFLFENNSLLVFNSVLPILSEYSEKNSIAALSFLHATLCSPRILDEFFVWLFNNIKTFNERQILSFFVVLRSLMSIEYITNVLLSQLIRHDFVDVVSIILKRDLQDETYRNIYNLVESFYFLLRKLSLKDKIIVNELINIENPFQSYFGHCKAIFPSQKSLQLIIVHSNDSFCNSIAAEVRPFWFIYEFEQERKSELIDINSFLSKFETNQIESVQIKEIPQNLTDSMIRCFVSKPLWISELINDPKSVILLHDHCELLNKTIDELNEKKNDNSDEEDFVAVQFQEKSLFEELIEIVSSSSNDNQSFSLFNELSQNDIVLVFLMKIMTKFINKSSSIKSIIDILLTFSSRDKFKENFVTFCGNELLDVILTPEFRTIENLLVKTADLFIKSDSSMPNRVIHLIEFMFLTNNLNVIQSAILLALKIEKKKQEFLTPFIMKTFDKSAKIENKMLNNIPLLLNSFPIVAQNRISQLLTLLDQFLTFYEEENENKEQLFDLIGSIFNVLAPKRNKTGNSTNKFVFENEVPSYISTKSPDFWLIYSKHREFIMKELYKEPLLLNSTFKFLLEYPELVNFNIRLSYFNETKEKISKEEILDLTMIRLNILNDSLNQMNQLSIQDFLKMIQIQFVGESNKIQSNDWYRSLIKELFHPKNYIFIYSENKKSFQINPRSEVNKQHLDYFKFAGKIIARAILENEGLNIHLTSSLYKTILQIQLELEDLKEIDYKLFVTLQKKLNENLNKIKKNDENDDSMVFTLAIDSEEEEEEANDDEDDEQPKNSNQIYIDSKVDYRLKGQIKGQINAFCDGFYLIIPQNLIKIFFPNELDLLICGMPFIDVNDLKKNVEFEYPLNFESQSVKLFFSAISKWDQDKLAQLMLFITKSANSILFGFKALKEAGNPIRIANGNDIDLPQSHPFINLLLLPEYKDEDALNWKFFIAFNETNSKTSITRKKSRRYK